MSTQSKIGYLIGILSVIILLVLRFIIGGWVTWFWGFFIAAGLALLAAIFFDRKLYLDFFTMRTTKHGANMGVLILMSLALAMAVNYLGFRFNKTADLTEEKLNSLSDQSQGVLKSLKGDVMFTVLYSGAEMREQRQQIREDLAMYVDSSSKVKLRFINSYENPGIAREFLKEKKVPFAIFVEYQGRRVLMEEPYSETSVTSAIIKASRETQKTIYFVTGHGEADIDVEGEGGLKSIRSGLEEMSFRLAKLNLATDTLPSSDDVIAVIGPRTGFLEPELDAIREFVKKGGRLLLAIDPGFRHNLANLTRSFGVEFKNNYILTEQLQQYGLATMGVQFDPNSEITRGFPTGRFFTVLFEASELSQASEAPKGWTFHELVKTEGRSVALNDPRQKMVNSDAKARVVGAQMDIPADIQKTEKPDKTEGDAPAAPKSAMVVIFGDSDFISDKAIFQMGNRDLALNTFATLGREPELVGIRPRQPKGSTLMLTRPKMIGIVSAGVSLPIILLIMSGFFWYRRRNL